MLLYARARARHTTSHEHKSMHEACFPQINRSSRFTPNEKKVNNKKWNIKYIYL